MAKRRHGKSYGSGRGGNIREGMGELGHGYTISITKSLNHF